MCRSWLSRMMVTGPSLTSSTSIAAPNSPWRTGTPRASRAVPNSCTNGSATAGAAAPVKLGRRPLRVFGNQGELRHHQHGPRRIQHRSIHAPVRVRHDAQIRDLLREISNVVGTVALRRADQRQEPRANGRHLPAAHGYAGSRDSLDDDAHGDRASIGRGALRRLRLRVGFRCCRLLGCGVLGGPFLSWLVRGVLAGVA